MSRPSPAPSLEGLTRCGNSLAARLSSCIGARISLRARAQANYNDPLLRLLVDLTSKATARPLYSQIKRRWLVYTYQSNRTVNHTDEELQILIDEATALLHMNVFPEISADCAKNLKLNFMKERGFGVKAELHEADQRPSPEWNRPDAMRLTCSVEIVGVECGRVSAVLELIKV